MKTPAEIAAKDQQATARQRRALVKLARIVRRHGLGTSIAMNSNYAEDDRDLQWAMRVAGECGLYSPEACDLCGGRPDECDGNDCER